MKPTPCIVTLWLLTAALLASACGPEEGGDLALRLYFHHPEADPALRADPPPEGEAPPDISDYRICVSAPDMGKVRCENFVVQANRNRARLSGLSVGRDRRVTFQGYNVSNFVAQWCGEVSGVAVRDGATTQVSMYLSVCSNFTPTRNAMGNARAFHTASPMPDGRVLVVGGFNSISGAQACDVGQCHRLTAASSIDVYDPRTGAFEATGLTLAIPRAMHTATPLPGGRLLLAGGVGQAVLRTSFPAGPRPVLEADPLDPGQAGSTAEVVNLLSLSLETQAPVPLAPTSPRAHHAALGMAGGDALLLAGIVPSTNAALRSMGRFQAAAGAFQDLPDALAAARQGMAVVPFGTASYLLWGGNHAAGGGPGVFAEIIREGPDGPLESVPAFVTNDPGRGAPLFYSAGAAQGEYRALFAGGMILDAAYDPSLTDRVRPSSIVRMVDLQEGLETFVDLGATRLNFERALHAMVALPSCELVNGQDKETATAMVLGGVINYNNVTQLYQLTNRVEFFTTSQVFKEKQTNAGEIWMNAARAGHVVTPLPDRTFLITGGLGAPTGALTVLDSAEVFNPASRELQVR